MLSLDEGGKISIWLPSADPDPAIAGLRLSNQPITQRIAMEKSSHACIVGQQLWVAAHTRTKGRTDVRRPGQATAPGQAGASETSLSWAVSL